jgi:hypothetical protein
MPTYDGTYKLAVEDGRVLIRDVEGGSQSTHVPLEIYSNYAAQGTLTDSRQLRLRTQPYLESNTANAYVTDMGIESGQTDNYFFITAPQKTANAGDRSTFVISKTSNVGIGTTDPEKPLHVVGDSWVTGTLTASNIIGASPVTISSNLVMASGFTLTAGAIEPPTGGGTLTTSNIVGSSFLTVTANTNVVAEFTESSRYYNVKEPRSAMTADSSFGYTASASSYYDNNVVYIPWQAFDGVISNDNIWISAAGTYDANGIATSSDSFNSVNGSYITIELPTNIKLNYAYIYGRDPTNSNPRRPKTGILYGSTDNSSWTEIGNFSIASLPSIAFGPEIIPHTTGYYKYFRLQITSVFTTGTYDACAITELELYGTPYTSATNDGTSVIFKSVPNTPKTDFLEVYYDAKEYESGNITDESGNGNTGTPTNVTFNSTEPKSFEFNGTSSYISATFNSNTLDAGNVHSICMWIKPNAIQSSYKSLFQCGQASNDSSTGVFLVNGRVAFLHFGSNLESDYLVEVDKWYFITCTYSPGRKIYVNSQFVTSDSYSALNISNFSAKLGANLSNAELFNGSIANFRFYDRPLSEDEIWEIYSYQKAYFSVSPDVVTYKAGRVGIGTSEPRAVLDVVGDASISGGLKLPHMRVYRNADVPITHDGALRLNSIREDNFSGWDTTNYVYTVPMDGVYIICGSAYVSSGASRFVVFINDASKVWLFICAATETYAAGSVSMRLNKGDRVNIRALSSCTVYYGVSGYDTTWMSMTHTGIM